MQEAIDARYQTLSKRLRSVGYYEPMHPDSIALVQRLMKDLQKFSSQVQSLSKKNSQNNSQISNNTSCVSKSSEQSDIEYKLNLLNKQYCDAVQKLK